MPEVPFQVPKAIAPRDYVNLFKDDATMVRFIKRYGPEHTVRLLNPNPPKDDFGDSP